MSPKAMRHKSSLWLKIVGWAGVVVGLTGLILPIIPGIPILIAGLVTLVHAASMGPRPPALGEETFS